MALVCAQGIAQNNCLIEAELRVTQTSLGSPPEGPFLPGEFITFSFTILNYRADQLLSGNQCQWLQGVIPVFGNGWDPASFRPDGQPNPNTATLPSEIWEWYPEDEVRYNFPTEQLAVYIDEVFDRKSMCAVGHPDCDFDPIAEADTPLPGGWFVTTEDSRAPCPLAGQDPNDSWGIPQECGTNRNHGTFTFRMRVRPFEGSEGCQTTGHEDLSVEIFTFTDGEIGCFVGDNDLCSFDNSWRLDREVSCVPTNNANRFYNNSVPICFSNDNPEVSVAMGNLPAFNPRSWPGCSGADQLLGANWYSFVAHNTDMRIAMDIEDCINDNGVRWSLYEIPCAFSMSQPNGSANPNGLGAPLLGCGNLSTPLKGREIIEFAAIPGQLYGILIDGWEGDLCNITFETLTPVVLGSIGGLSPGVPETDFTVFGFDGDTICLGAEDVLFTVPNPLDNACRYQWLLRSDDPTRTFSYHPELSLSFDKLGEYELCVFATNYCATTITACRDIVVAPSKESYFVKDTICRGGRYTWLGPEGDILEEIPPQNDTGLQTFTLLLDNTSGCAINAVLELQVREVNFDQPTVVDTFACYDLVQSDAFVFFCDTLEDPGFYEMQACVSPITACDTFFNINFDVLGGPFGIDARCDGLGNMTFSFIDVDTTGYTPWKDQLERFDSNDDFSIERSWTALNTTENLGQSETLTLTQSRIEELARNNVFSLTLSLDIFYKDNFICRSDTTLDIQIRENFPTIDAIVGDINYCLGDDDLSFSAIISDPLNPLHQEPEDMVDLTFWTLPDGFTFIPPSDAFDSDINVRAPETNPGSSICLRVTTDRCRFIAERCETLQQAEVELNITPIDSCNQSVFEVVEADDFPPQTYDWSIIDGRIYGSSATPQVIASPFSTTDTAFLSVRLIGDCVGIGMYAIPPSDHLIIENIEDNPRDIYIRTCTGSQLLVLTEDACSVRWGYMDTLTFQSEFPIVDEKGEEWAKPYLEVANGQSNSSRLYFVERLINCEDCDNEIIFFSRNAERVVCQEEGDIRIFPNPNEGQFNVAINGYASGKYHIYLLDMLGRSVLQCDITHANGDSNTQVEAINLPTGTYHLTIEHNGQIIHRQKLLIFNH